MAVFQAKPSQKPHKNFYAYYRKDLTQIRYKRRKPPAVTIYRENFAPKKFTGKEQDQETGLYYYGARYLDPKTSRWLSTDPALGDYLPVAPNNDDAKKHNQNLPGMGGVFNVVNLHVYHYAGNNPVKYVDPDGERPLFFWEKISITIILGKGHNQILNRIDLQKSQVTRQQLEAAGNGYNNYSASQIDDIFNNNYDIGQNGISLPDGSIYIPRDARNSRKAMKSLLMHEVFHQLQYADNKASTFQTLVGELDNGITSYGYDLDSVTTLQTMPTLESQAKLIEDFADGYYAGRHFLKKDSFDPETVQRAQIMKDSGINSKAVNRVLDSQIP